MPDAARSLFDSFREGDGASLARIRRAIADNEAETAHLDFKENRDQGGPSARLTEHSRDNLGKAISGFGNVGGGVIVWGVEAKDGKQSRPSAIPNVADFVQQLYTHTGGICDEPVEGVEHVGVEDPDFPGRGYAVTYVPESRRKPHQCVASKKTTSYWMRVGSNIEVMPHAIIRALMLERQRPELKIGVSKPYVFHDLASNSPYVLQAVNLLNMGEAVARDVAIAVRRYPPTLEFFAKRPVDENINQTISTWDEPSDPRMGRTGTLYRLILGSVVYPGTQTQVFVIRRLFGAAETFEHAEMDFSVYCDGYSNRQSFGYHGQELVQAGKTTHGFLSQLTPDMMP